MVKSERGQSSLELAILFAVVILAFVALQFYVRNAAAGRLKSSAESISQTQFDPLVGSTNLTVNRVTKDQTFAGDGVPMSDGTTGTVGQAGQMISTSTKDDMKRTDQ